MTGKQSQYRKSVEAACPELTVHSAALDSSGQNNDLLLVNDELLFRFPKYAQGVAALRREHAILHAVRAQLPLATPHFIYHNMDNAQAGRAFAAYRKLPGAPLWTETFAQIDDDGTIDSLATDLATFLQALHAIPPHSIDHPLPLSDTPAGWHDLFARIRQIVYPHLTADARRWTTEQFVPFVESADQFAFTNVLRHGDFGPSNILYSAERRRFIGIIDFGSAGIGDPAVDFAGLCGSYGEPFVQRCARVYPLIDLCWERIRFYADCAFLLEDALFCIEHDTAEASEVIAEVNQHAAR